MYVAVSNIAEDAIRNIQEQQEEANMAKYFIHIGGRNYGFYS